ncbi:hypothetical protein ACFE04_001476 [Oxalis oulophora]
MEEAMRIESELRKRNTDCVYFLASPLTCKKGLNCEYRHNQMARFNTTDCWYWLAGNCVNPNCAFRHPSLESRVDAPSKSAMLAYECSVTTNKTDVPCYFYYNGYCNKGDNCHFLHDYDTSGPNGKSSKTTNATINDALPDNKASTKSDTSSPPQPVPVKIVNVISQSEGNLRPKAVRQQNASQKVSSPECNEISMIEIEPLLPKGKSFTPRKFDQVEDFTEPEQLWESYPGFNVRVNKKLGNANNDDSEFTDESLSDDSCHSSENDFMYEVRGIPSDSQDYFLPYKRKVSLTEMADDQEAADLRNSLKKHGVIDNRPTGRLSRSRLNTREYLKSKRGFGSDMKKTGGLKRNLNISHHFRGAWLENSMSNKFRQQHYKGKKFSKERFLSSEFLKRKPDSRGKRRKTQASPKFTGPKTLAQIKEEKEKAKENHNSILKTTSTDFQGPRPLSEILKEKKKLCSAENGNFGSCY